MSEQQLSGGGPSSDASPTCPWCSAALPSPDLATCPSCGASLKEAADDAVPGVTQIDVEAVLRGRQPVAKSRGLLGWLAGEYEEEAKPDAPETLEPPDEAVRREMLRMELAALEAEVQARQAEAVAEAADAGIDVSALIDGTDEAGTADEEAEAGEAPPLADGAEDDGKDAAPA